MMNFKRGQDPKHILFGDFRSGRLIVSKNYKFSKGDKLKQILLIAHTDTYPGRIDAFELGTIKYKGYIPLGLDPNNYLFKVDRNPLYYIAANRSEYAVVQKLVETNNAVKSYMEIDLRRNKESLPIFEEPTSSKI